MEPSEVQVVPTTQLLAGLTALLGTHGPFTTMTLRLYANPITLQRSTLLADLTEATFVGYAAAAGVTFSASYVDVDGSALALGADNVFICTSATTPNTIYGYYFTDAGNTNLLIAYSFANPVPISAVGNAVAIAPFVRYSGT